MRKKGFTLVELLATIVIISVISLIAVPIVINVIEKTKKASFEQTLNSLLNAADIYQVKEEVTGGITDCRYFSFSSDVEDITVRDNKTYYPLKDLSLKGKIPTEGELKICENGITLEASNGSYAGSYDGNGINVNKGDLASNDFTTPIIDTFNVTATLDRIVVSVLAHSPGIGGVISNYYYKINDGEYIKTTENSYIFDKLNANEKLTPNTEYTISIKVENKSGVIKEESKTVKTKAFGEITIDVENNGTWTTSKKVTLSGTTDEYEMEYMIEKYNPETNEDVTSEFEKYENPFTLDTVATTLHPTTITVRYSSNGNYSDYKSYSVTKIDTTSPTVTSPSVNVSTSKPTSEASVVIRQEDLESGLDESTIEYGYSEEANGTYKWQTNALLTKLTSGKKYYVKTKVKNNVGLETESEIKEYTPGEINTCSVTPLQSGWTTNKDVQIKGSQTGTELQYQVGATEDDSWVSIGNNGTVNITENTTVYCRLWDGTTSGAYGSGSVNQIDRTEPSLELGTITKTTTTLTIPFTATDTESQISGTTCVYGTSTSYGKTGTVSGNKCTISGLIAGTTYYYKLVTTNNSGLTKEATGDTASGSTSISYSTSQTPDNTTYAQSKAVTVTYNISNVTSPVRYVKTSVATTSSVDGYACGTGTDPSTCGTTATKSFAANTWYKVASNPVVTFKANGTVYARINDGASYSASSSLSIEKIDTSVPTLTIGTISKTTTTLTIPFTATDTESQISGTTCVYGTSTSYGKTGTVSGNKCTISGLTAGTTYYYKLVTTNNSGLTKEATGNTASGSTSISYSTSQTPENTTYAQSKAVTVTYNISNVTSPVRYVKTSVATTSSVNGYACGTSTDPSTCGTTATKSFAANTWYKVTSNPVVTFKSNGTVYARINDGASYSASSSLNIEKIDTTAPTLTLGTATSTTTSITIPISTFTDNNLIGSISSCKYSRTSGSYTTAGSINGTTSCTLSSLANGTTYYYQVCAKDNAGNETCKTGSKATLTPTAFKVGDYVKMTPTSTSYPISTELTGYSSDQTINPSELNLWRVIRINSDGTIDIVSEYVSSTKVSFKGKTGYANLVGSLNTIASQYANTKYTTGARHMGYSNQTQNLSSFNASSAPATSTTSSSTTSAQEAKGAGDMGYQTDYDLVNTALGTLIAYKVSDTSTASAYWLASRCFIYTDSTEWSHKARCIRTGGSLYNYTLAGYSSGSEYERINGPFAVRPIVTLKSGLAATGSGTSSSPYVLN